MDIDLLSKMVKELILDNDSVTLPGIGSFVAEIVPSTFSDKGYTIHPPYRRLFFTQREGSDTLLVDAYCSANDATREDATRILVTFLMEMKEVLKVRKSIVFPGLGRLRATRENNFFFVADEDLDIYPAGFGLESVSLKSHVETSEEVSAAIAGLKAALDEPAPQAPEEPLPVGPEPLAAADLEIEPETPAAPAEVPVAPLAETPVEVSAAPVAVSEAPTEPAPIPAPEHVVEENPVAPLVSEPVAAEAPAETPAAEPVVEETPAPAATPAPEKRPVHSGWRRFWRSVLVLLFTLIALAALAVIVFILLDQFAPQILDRLLYNSEQLKILYY